MMTGLADANITELLFIYIHTQGPTRPSIMNLKTPWWQALLRQCYKTARLSLNEALNFADTVKAGDLCRLLQHDGRAEDMAV